MDQQEDVRRMICPICTNQDDITWADLVADMVELCDEHQSTPDGELPLPRKSK